MLTRQLNARQGEYRGILSGSVRRDVTTEEYAEGQEDYQPGKARAFVLPILREAPVRTVLDIGCGVGAKAATLEAEGYESYGVDLPGLERRWAASGRRPDRFFLVDPNQFQLPFMDGAFDFAFSFGVIEHVGTTDGHANRRPDWHDVRRAWLREIIRVLRPGGRLLLGGPNRNFPVDVAHGPDSMAAYWERWLSRLAGLTIHRTWGDNFLWSFSDVRRYIDGLPCQVEARNVDGFLEFSRAPRALRGLARLYVRHLPQRLLGTGMNPWVIALVTRVS